MPSISVLRAAVTATLGLGVADLVVLNAVLAPHALSDDEPPAVIARAPDPPPPPPPALDEPRDVPSPPEILDERVYFATMSAQLDQAALAKLRQTVARTGATAIFALEGRADVRGAEGLNLDLSKQRAQAVAIELEKLGIARVRIEVGFVGSTGASPTGELWRDRRVDLRVTGGRR